ncbi:MAG: hypothetical protein HQL66_00915 [Magnetococcales bacterium]|nr:hypothetical protein [Magnetococcales bacterium]
MAINLDVISAPSPPAPPLDEGIRRARDRGWTERIWFPRRRSDGGLSASDQPTLWPKHAVKVTLSEVGRLLAGAVDRLGTTVVSRLLAERRRADLYDRLGRSQGNLPSSLGGQQGQGDADPSIWPQTSSRVTLSDGARLASGVIAHLDTSREEQEAFLRQVHEASQQGRLGKGVLAEARRLVQRFLVPDSP